MRIRKGAVAVGILTLAGITLCFGGSPKCDAAAAKAAAGKNNRPGWKFSAIRSSKRGWPYRRCGPKSCSRTAGSKRPIRIRSVSDGATPILSGKWPVGQQVRFGRNRSGRRAGRRYVRQSRQEGHPLCRRYAAARHYDEYRIRSPAYRQRRVAHLLIQQDFENRPNVGRISPSRFHDGAAGSSIATKR